MQPEPLQRQPVTLDVPVRALKRRCVLSQPVRLALGTTAVVVGRGWLGHQASMADSSSLYEAGSQARCSETREAYSAAGSAVCFGTLSTGATVARAKTATTTVADLDAEIARLQKQRDTLRATEVKAVVGRIKEAIAHYGLTAEDLGLAPKRRGRMPAAGAVEPKQAKKRAPKGAAKVASKKPPSPPKYSNGVDKTWSGHGKRPGWFVDALAAGKTAEDLLIKVEA